MNKEIENDVDTVYKLANDILDLCNEHNKANIFTSLTVVLGRVLADEDKDTVTFVFEKIINDTIDLIGVINEEKGG